MDYPHIGPSSIGLVSKAAALVQSQRGSVGNRADLSDYLLSGIGLKSPTQSIGLASSSNEGWSQILCKPMN